MNERGPRAPDPPPLVIGLGNEHRGDDACGILVARLLRSRIGEASSVVEWDAEGTELLDLWEGRAFVVVVDAVRTGARPGTVHRFVGGKEPLPGRLGITSSHGLSLAQAIGFGQALHRLPRRLVVYGIEADSFEPGGGLSAPVEAALGSAAERIEAEVRSASEDPLDTGPRERADA